MEQQENAPEEEGPRGGGSQVHTNDCCADNWHKKGVAYVSVFLHRLENCP